MTAPSPATPHGADTAASAVALNVALIGLGGNLGDRRAMLRSAVEALVADGTCTLLARSALHETSPLGPALHPFLNAAVAVKTRLDAPSLLRRLLTIEVQHGRERRERWGPRTLDLDLLVAWDEQGALVRHHEDGLTLPHPRLLERDFVLVPLAEVVHALAGAGHCVASALGERALAEHLALLDPSVRTLQGIVAGPDSW